MENNLLLTIESLYENLLKGMNLFFSFTIVCTSSNQSSMLVYACNLSMWEVEAGKLEVQDKLTSECKSSLHGTLFKSYKKG